MKTNFLFVAALWLLPAINHTEAQGSAPDTPRQITINMFGEVNRPGRYLLPEGATVLDALGAAGGESQQADLKRVVCIHATTGDKPSTDKIDVQAVLKGTQVSPVLHDGDSLKVNRQIANIAF